MTWLQPALAAGRFVPWWGLISAAAAFAALLAWYLVELTTRGGMSGLAERAMCVALVGWPLAVVLSCRRPAQR